MNIYDTIIFLHIPKTAGTTLNEILQQQFEPEQIYFLGPTAQKTIREYQELEAEEKEPVRLVSGHTPYGFHEYVAGSSTYFTFLRDPVDRVVSFYHFVRKNEQHYLNSAVVNEFDGIKSFINSGITTMVDNGQTRLISGVWLKPGFGEVTSQDLEQAKLNLKQNFSVVGLTEQFDATLLLFREIFTWQNIKYVRQNVSKVSSTDRKLTPEEREAIVNVNQLDIALYEYAQTLFEEQISGLGQDFPEQLERFQRQNLRYQTYRVPVLLAIERVKRFSIRAFIRGIFPR